jgi:hypothetical protein
MRRIRRILGAIKDPAATKPAVAAKAARLARPLGAELLLFHAISTPLYLKGGINLPNGGLADAEREARTACLARLQAVASPAATQGHRDSYVFRAV